MKLKKINIMKTRPDISDEEIQAMMDFDKVLERHRSAKTTGRFMKPALLITGTVLVIAVVGSITIQPTRSVESTTSPEVEKTEKRIVIPEETHPPATTVIPEARRSTSKKLPGIKTETKPEPAASDVYAEAEPIDGYPELYTYFQKELTYPLEALKDSVEGIVSVSFVINRDGKPEQIKILNSLGAPFDNEAIRVISNMPGWKPASLNGKPMPARISIPLTFHIERTQKQP
jgi:TonB family protein